MRQRRWFILCGRNSNEQRTSHPLPQLSSDSVVAALTSASSLRTLTGLTFVPAALIVPSSFKSEGGVLLHSSFPMKFTMSTSPPLATICVIRRRAATSTLFQGPAGCCLDFVQLACWSSGILSDNCSDHLLSNQTVPASTVVSH